MCAILTFAWDLINNFEKYAISMTPRLFSLLVWPIKCLNVMLARPGLQLEKIKACHNEASDGKYVPRAIFVDPKSDTIFLLSAVLGDDCL
jgi:hypothetical protein